MEVKIYTMEVKIYIMGTFEDVLNLLRVGSHNTKYNSLTESR